MNTYDFLVREWNCGGRIKSVVRRAKVHGIDPQVVVTTFKHFAKKYGYSGMVPVLRESKPHRGRVWEDLGNGLLYSKEGDLFFKNGVHRDRYSAEWAGWIGAGVELKTIINSVR